MNSVDRGRAMAASVVRAARTHGLAPEGVDLLSLAHALAMESRVEMLDDDHHPSYLHPGRSVLMLLQDVGPLPAEILATAAVHDSEDDDLRVSWDAVRDTLGDAVADMVESLPLPGEERLTERLVGLDEGACLAALAERLDHLRHAHLREDRTWWRAIHEEAGAAWVPVAERTHPRLATRYRHWHRTFARRLQGSVPGGGR
jgi:(p)ppGpp synthase/HD superfamily hydrolase